MVLVEGALVGRSWGRAGRWSDGRLVSFLTVFPLSGVREERGTVIMGRFHFRPNLCFGLIDIKLNRHVF